jgi:hypothetical protein
VVGPGVYGDIDGDGHSVTPGDEVASPGCDCAIAITKSVTVESSAGAGATAGAVVRVMANGTTIRHNVLAGNGIAVLIDGGTRTPTGTVITFNNLVGNALGHACAEFGSIDTSPFLTRAVTIGSQAGR